MFSLTKIKIVVSIITNFICSTRYNNMSVLLKIYRVYFEEEQGINIISVYPVRNINRLFGIGNRSGLHEHSVKATIGRVFNIIIIGSKIIKTEQAIIDT